MTKCRRVFFLVTPYEDCIVWCGITSITRPEAVAVAADVGMTHRHTSLSDSTIVFLNCFTRINNASKGTTRQFCADNTAQFLI